jgi:hypothetical protein
MPLEIILRNTVGSSSAVVGTETGEVDPLGFVLLSHKLEGTT